MTKTKLQNGFTIIELLIATVIFSVILLMATSGVIRIGQMYYKGITEAKTQDASRRISEELSRAVQFSDNEKTNVDNAGDPYLKIFCFGDTRYTANLDKLYVDRGIGTGTGLVAERLATGSPCGCAGGCVETAQQLLGHNMRLLKLDISQIAAGQNAWRVDLRVAYGENDLLTHYDDLGNLLPGDPDVRLSNLNNAACKSGISGGSFCAVSQLDTVVKKRLN